MKRLVFVAIFVALIGGGILFLTYDQWKPRDPRIGNEITTYGDNRSLIPTPETDRLCKEEAGFFIYEKRPVDGLTESEPLCDLSCELLLFDPKGPQLPYLEFFVTKEGWWIASGPPLAGNDPSVRPFLVDGPGWHRFEIAKWGAPNTEAYMKRERSRAGALADLNDRFADGPEDAIPPEALETYGYMFGKAIAVTRINGPTAPYRRIEKERKRLLVLGDLIQVRVVEDSVIDVKTGMPIASAVSVYGRYYARNRDGTQYDTPSGGYCGAQIDDDALTKIFVKPGSQ